MPRTPPKDASVEALLAGAHRAALEAASDSDEEGEAYDRMWLWIHELRNFGGQAVFGAAARWRRDEDAALRGLAAKILGQLRPALDSPEFARACIAELLPLLDDADDDVLGAALYSLGHLYGEGHVWDVELVACHADHPSQDVRHACCFALGGSPAEDHPKALTTLIGFMDDVAHEVRDWATFGAAANSEADSPELRVALVARLEDPEEIVRAEAICGLAKRHDPRAHAAIIDALESGQVMTPIFDAIEAMPSPDFIELLQGYRENDPECDGILAAVEACKEEAQGRSAHRGARDCAARGDPSP